MQNQANGNNFIKVSEVSKIAKVTTRTVYNWIWAGILPSSKTKTNRVRVNIEDLAEFLNVDINKIAITKQNSEDE